VPNALESCCVEDGDELKLAKEGEEKATELHASLSIITVS
jgi:hypothetical protein